MSFLLTRVLTMNELTQAHSSFQTTDLPMKPSLPNLVSFVLTRLLTMSSFQTTDLIVPNDRSQQDLRCLIWWDFTHQTTYDEWASIKLTHRSKRQISTRPSLPNLVSFLLTRLLTMDEPHSSSLIVANNRSQQDLRYLIWWVSHSPDYLDGRAWLKLTHRC